MKKAFINSLPKAGTNLLAKCLTLAGYHEKWHLGANLVMNHHFLSISRRIFWRPFKQGYLIGIDTPVEVARRPIENRFRHIKDNEFISAHVGYTTDILQNLLEQGFAPIVVIRDPRAVLSSFVHYVVHEKSHALHRRFIEMQEEERFRAALLGTTTGSILLQPLRVRCMALDAWLSSENVLVVKFENLVGIRGGSSDEMQKNTLNSIFKWLNIPEEKIDFVAENLFGQGRHTFRKGRIDSWTDELPPNIHAIAENTLSDILKKWNY